MSSTNDSASTIGSRTESVRPRIRARRGLLALAVATGLGIPLTSVVPSAAANPLPTMVDSKLAVRVMATELDRPISMGFLPDGSALVLEKSTGKVQHVQAGVVTTVLDLNVNSNVAPASERGLLGIAMHPAFASNGFVYLFWSESSTSADTAPPELSPVLGNRVDRFVWDGEKLTLDKNLLRLRSRRDDGSVQKAGHVGGVLRFGPDGKLYIVTGDVGRRGQLQNLPCGWELICPGHDDSYGNGGPSPDDAHLTGVILRLNDDGTTPTDNPFYSYGASVGQQLGAEEVGANLQKIFAYGVRNSFGMAFDPASGALWDQENGEDGYDEINRVDPGFNSGWIQVMGSRDRYQDFHRIETEEFPEVGSGEARYPTRNLAGTFDEALARLFVLPGSHYSDPEFSWRYALSPAGLGFIEGRALGPQYRNDMVVGSTRGGLLLRFQLTGNRQKVGVDDPHLEDRVADNTRLDRTAESENLTFGTGFGIVTDVQTGPNGNLYVIDHIGRSVYEIYRTAK